jgi:rhodanese-related sulfurtransferase
MADLADLQEDVPPQRAAELVRHGSVQLVDVREPYEHEAGHIAGDRHVELTRLTDEAASIDRDRPVLFYCRVGNRSAMASQAFRAAGFDAYNLEGGLVAWTQAGLPLEPEGGVVADH